MNLEHIKVSIVTPVYNDEKYIKDTIDSVLNQTHHNFEILVVDDASTDETVKIVESYNDPRIKLFKNETNLGAAYSRNLAIKEATGDYVAFLDGDDLWLPTKLESQLLFMIDNNYYFTCSDYYIVDERGNQTGTYVTGPKVIFHRSFLKTNYVGCLTVVYKKDCFPDLCIPTSIRKRNDYALWLKLSEKEPCYRLSERLALYRKREARSISSSNRFSLIKKHQEMFCLLYDFSYVKSLVYAYRNLFYYLLRIALYRKKIH